MARGQVATRPWSRRLLLPLVIRVLPVSSAQVPRAFLVLNLLSLAAMAVGTGLLTWRLARRIHAERSRAQMAAVVSGLLLFLMPLGFHWTAFYPTLVDVFAAALTLWWLLTSTATNPRC